jgi:hypothetical protein
MQTLKINAKQSATGKITDRIKTFEDACNELGIQKAELTAAGEIEADFISVAAYQKLIIIARALNEGWTPNWKDIDEYKYYPWFDLSSGSGLSYDVFVGQRSSSDVGSRLCFKSGELAEYAGKQFIELYKEFFLI